MVIMAKCSVKSHTLKYVIHRLGGSTGREVKDSRKLLWDKERKQPSSHRQEDLWLLLNRGPECAQLMGGGGGLRGRTDSGTKCAPNPKRSRGVGLDKKPPARTAHTPLTQCQQECRKKRLLFNKPLCSEIRFR